MSFRRTAVTVVVILLLAEGMARLIAPHIPDPPTWSNPFAQAKHQQLLDVEARGGAEILLVGSSIVNASIDASVLEQRLGVQAYNAGLPSTTVAIWNQYLRDVALDLACPQLVIAGISPRDSNRNEPGQDRTLRRYADARGRRAAIGQLSLLGRIQDAGESVSEFLRIRASLRQPRALYDWVRGGDAAGWEEIDLDDWGRYLGFADDFYEEADMTRQIERLSTGDFVDFNAGGSQFESLERAAQAARRNGATFAIVDMPAMDSGLAGALDDGVADLDRYRATLETFAAERDIPLLRLPHMVDQPEYFADLYHMNEAGTQEISTHIADWVESGEVPFGPGCTG